MDFQEEKIEQNTQETVELDQDFMDALEIEEIKFSRADDNLATDIILKYVTNSMEVLNDRLDYEKYNPENDIVNGEYEGGFTVWEGTYDLINFILHHGERLDLNGKNVLDLGCGHGLVGIFALKAFDNVTVCFQDYNLDVLKFATVPT